MKAFRVGFIASLSFFIILGIFTTTLGFYPPPKGQKMPEYPKYPTVNYTDPNYQSELQKYDVEMKKYDTDLKKYQEGQKTFAKDKIIPYARNVFVGWIMVILGIELVGLVVSSAGYQLVGGGWAFSGVWAILFGPIGSLLWYANTLIASFTRQAEQEYSTDPVLQAVAISCIVAVIAMSGVGIFLEKAKRPFIA